MQGTRRSLSSSLSPRPFTHVSFELHDVTTLAARDTPAIDSVGDALSGQTGRGMLKRDPASRMFESVSACIHILFVTSRSYLLSIEYTNPSYHRKRSFHHASQGEIQRPQAPRRSQRGNPQQRQRRCPRPVVCEEGADDGCRVRLFPIDEPTFFFACLKC